MLLVAQVAVCSQINTKHINTVWTERTVVENLVVDHVTSRLYKVNLLCTSPKARQSMYSYVLPSNILYFSVTNCLKCELNQNYMNVLSVDLFRHILIVAGFYFMPLWRRPQELPKHVGGLHTVLWLRFFLPWLSFYRALSSVVRQMPG